MMLRIIFVIATILVFSTQFAYASLPAASHGKRVSAEIIGVDNIKAADTHFYYRFKLKYPDKTISYGYIPVKKLELWYADLNNIVGSVLEFSKMDAPSPDLRESGGYSIVNPKVIY